MTTATDQKTPEDLGKIIEKAVEDNIETIYFNGFTNALGVGDVVILLQKNSKSVAILNTSYTVAKTLAIKLGEMISFLEDKTSQKMLTTDQITKFTTEEKEGGRDDK